MEGVHIIAHRAVHNGFVISARHDAGELGITHDVEALKEVVRPLERGTLPSARARLTGIYDLPNDLPASRCHNLEPSFETVG